jgi:hypothetical protein
MGYVMAYHLTIKVPHSKLLVVNFSSAGRHLCTALLCLLDGSKFTFIQAEAAVLKISKKFVESNLSLWKLTLQNGPLTLCPQGEARNE